MDKQINLSKSILIVAAVTGLLLMVPLIAMQFTTEVDWSVTDFIIMGLLLFCTGTSLAFVMRYAVNMIYKIAMLGAFGTTFLLIWANLAVGLIGSGPHIGNIIYLAVYAIVIIGSIHARFAATGMERVMYVAAVSLIVIATVAIIADMGSYPGSSVTEIIGVNGFFVMLYGIAGSLFRLSSPEKPAEKSAWPGVH